MFAQIRPLNKTELMLPPYSLYIMSHTNLLYQIWCSTKNTNSVTCSKRDGPVCSFSLAGQSHFDPKLPPLSRPAAGDSICWRLWEGFGEARGLLTVPLSLQLGQTGQEESASWSGQKRNQQPNPGLLYPLSKTHFHFLLTSFPLLKLIS